MTSIEMFVNLAGQCIDASPDQAEGLLLSAGPEIADYFAPNTSASAATRIGTLVTCDCDLQAVTELIPKDWGYMLSRGPNGRILASVFNPVAEQEKTMEGTSEALALFGALAITIAETMANA